MSSSNPLASFYTNFLMWNTQKKDLRKQISTLCKNHSIDVLVLVEAETHIMDLDAELRKCTPELPLISFKEGDRGNNIAVFSRFPRSNWKTFRISKPRISGFQVAVPGRLEFLLFVLHLPSKVRMDDGSQSDESSRYSEIIKSYENKTKIYNTIVCGDFNMNPFERGMIKATGFHAVAFRDEAKRNQRTVKGETYPFLYNPMWGWLGWHSPGPRGSSYYDASGEHVNYYWNLLDQVLIRPSLIDRFSDKDDLAIIETLDKGTTLTDRHGLPDKAHHSDHLPIFFRIDLTLRRSNGH